MDAIRGYRHAVADWWFARSLTMRWSAAGTAAGVLLGLVIALGFAAASGGSSEDEQPAVVATQTRTPEATDTPTETPSERWGPDSFIGSMEPLGDPALVLGIPAVEPQIPTVGTLSELNNIYGEAPDATLGRFRIPVLGVDAPIGQRFVAGSQMPSPTGPGDVVWYDFSQWPGLGGVPGGGGNAVFSGHVDYFARVAWAEAIYRGRGVFFNLTVLSPGDIIEVEVGGNVYQYAVVWRQQISAGPDGDWNSILAGNVAVDSITLITCGGEFDRNEASYDERVVIRAERI